MAAKTMTPGSQCRHLNSPGCGLIMDYTAAYQIRSLSFYNTGVDRSSQPGSQSARLLIRSIHVGRGMEEVDAQLGVAPFSWNPTPFPACSKAADQRHREHSAADPIQVTQMIAS